MITKPTKPTCFTLDLSDERVAEFNSRIDRRPRKSGCWHWTGATGDSVGYGAFRAGQNRATATHRVAYALWNGPIPSGLCVCHECDNPKCVNPGHLWLGTNSDNLRDMHRKGRGVPPVAPRGDKCNFIKNPEIIPRGEFHRSAKLKRRDVIAIRKRYATGDISMAKLGAEYGINPSSAYFVISRRTWKHVP